MQIRWICLVGLMLLTGTPARATGADALMCEQAARDAEREFRLPEGILLAIGKAESASWPWTANVDGAPEIFQSKAEAVEALTRLRSPKPGNVDVGCFQISMRYHPMAFATMAEAVDPAANAAYAARFLRDLYNRLGDWNQAIGAYHSMTQPLESAYRDRVLALWKGQPASRPPAAEEPDVRPRWRIIPIGNASPPGIAVWTLASIGDPRLPNVILPTR